MDSEAVIGLEVHVQLATREKLFCGCLTRFDAPPNSQVCDICLGRPGGMPALNPEAVELAVRAALALGCTVHERSIFSRKHYVYHDLPKGYQITQGEEPLATGGRLEFISADGTPRTIPLERLHLEEDTGRSMGDAQDPSEVDFNRAGIPLIEIVTAPLIRTPAEAREALTALRQLLRYTGVSECRMELGELRVDANISLRRVGEVAGPPIELKNLNSFSGVEHALTFEVERQRALLERGEVPARETRQWDSARRETRRLRSKERATEYRQTPEPDLPPLRVSRQKLKQQAEVLPELPLARARRLTEMLGISAEHSRRVTATRELADYYEAVVAAGSGAEAAVGWVLGEVLAMQDGDADLAPAPERVAELIALVENGAVTRAQARRILEEMLTTDETAAVIVERLGFRLLSAHSELRDLVERVLRENPEEVRRYRSGDRRLLGYFMGQAMQQSSGSAEPGALREILSRELGGDP